MNETVERAINKILTRIAKKHNISMDTDESVPVCTVKAMLREAFDTGYVRSRTGWEPDELED